MSTPPSQPRSCQLTLVVCAFLLQSLVVPSPTAHSAPSTFLGDTNCDGVVNYADIDPFVLALSGQAGYEAAYPACPWLNADCNGDGLVTYADIDPFVALLCGPIGACCDDDTEICTTEFALNCTGRFVAGAVCDPDPFTPPCGDWIPTGMLYAPTHADNATFRSAVSGLLSGAPVDYFDPRVGTPTLAQLREYACVMTWVNYAYSDKVAMGDVLADYVDIGGKVLLGQWTQPTANNFLAGAIMEIGGAYLPATATQRGSGTYAGDGYGCEFVGVSTLGASYRDNCTLTDIGHAIGTFTDGYLCVAHRADKRVWATPGNTGLDYSTGDWAQLTAGLCTCPDGLVYGACCNAETGLCIDNVEGMDCIGFPYQWIFETRCDDLVPSCGNWGACCDYDTALCTEEFEVNCFGRFIPGVPCLDAEFDPHCGSFSVIATLYCPSGPDNRSFRAQLSGALDRGPVHYFDASAATPTLAKLRDYDCVLTWANYAYADKDAMGDVLAQFADLGRRVLLGQWTQPTATNYLGGAIMEIGGPYLPATATTESPSTYAGDGYGRYFDGVDTLNAPYRDQCTPTDVGIVNGTWEDGYLCIARSAYRGVWVLPGHTGGDFGSGDWTTLTANLCSYWEQPEGACCNLETALCEDGVRVTDCFGYPLQWTYDTRCTDLGPPCGNASACCDDDTGVCTETLEVDCPGRFAEGESCDAYAFSPPCGDAVFCSHTIKMWDDDGDGWTGGYIDVYLDGELIASRLSLDSGFGPQTATIRVYHGGLIQTAWTSGYSPHEASYCVYDEDGEQILCTGLAGSVPTGLMFAVSCDEPE